MKKLIFPLSVLLLTTACVGNASTEEEGVSNAQQASQAIAAAEAAAKKADSVGYEWRDTDKLIKEAKSTMDKNDYKKAIQLADKARSQGELAYQQYLDQKGGASSH